MESDSKQTAGRVLGIGGVFFKSPDKPKLENWYRDALGLDSNPKMGGAQLQWRAHDNPSQEHSTMWSVFPQTTKHFGGDASFMINYIVDDMDAILKKLEAAGARIDPDRQEYDFGRFAWVYDPDGNKVELWQPLNK